MRKKRTYRQAVNHIESQAHQELGKSARSLGIVPGTACAKGHRGFMETWTNDQDNKHTWGYDACKKEVY